MIRHSTHGSQAALVAACGAGQVLVQAGCEIGPDERLSVLRAEDYVEMNSGKRLRHG